MFNGEVRGKVGRRVLVVVAGVTGAIAVAAFVGSWLGHDDWVLAAEGTAISSAVVTQLVTTDRPAQRSAIPARTYTLALSLVLVGVVGCVTAALTTRSVPVRIGLVILAVGTALTSVSLQVAHRRVKPQADADGPS